MCPGLQVTLVKTHAGTEENLRTLQHLDVGGLLCRLPGCIVITGGGVGGWVGVVWLVYRVNPLLIHVRGKDLPDGRR